MKHGSLTLPSLAVLGWYLMVPPLTGRPAPDDLNLDAPLGRWTVYEAFDRAAECEEAKVRADENLLAADQAGHPRPAWAHGQITMSQCIASDDPRLKERR
jgi:hypothetical protein